MKGAQATPGGQAWVFAIAVDPGLRRRGIGRALLAEVARRADLVGRTFLALVPQDGSPEQTAERPVFFRRCGLALIEPDGPGAAWGCPVTTLVSPAEVTRRPASTARAG